MMDEVESTHPLWCIEAEDRWEGYATAPDIKSLIEHIQELYFPTWKLEPAEVCYITRIEMVDNGFGGIVEDYGFKKY